MNTQIHDTSIEKQLLKAANRILSEKGYQALTIRRVCTEAKCSTSTFYQYFASKDELLLSFIVPDSAAAQDSFLSELSSVSHTQAILKIYTYVAEPFYHLDLEVLNHFITPSNIALDARFIGKSKRNNWILKELIRHLRALYEEGITLPGNTPWNMDKELRIIYYGCLFHWIISEKEHDLITTLMNLMTRYLNTCLKEEFQLKTHH